MLEILKSSPVPQRVEQKDLKDDLSEEEPERKSILKKKVAKYAYRVLAVIGVGSSFLLMKIFSEDEILDEAEILGSFFPVLILGITVVAAVWNLIDEEKKEEVIRKINNIYSGLKL